MVVAIKSEAVTTAKTTTTTTSRSSKPKSEKVTCDLFTGDLVRLDAFSDMTNGRVFRVLAHTPSTSCESGTLIAIQATSNVREKYVVDRHWLWLDTRASVIYFDDDIPF